MIIDFHTHTFPDKIAASTVQHLKGKSHTENFSDGTISGLAEKAKNAGIDYSINLPVMTSTSQVEKINEKMVADCEAMLEKGIITFGGIHPDYENYRDALLFLQNNGIKGIKIHPTYQGVDIDDIRFMRILDYANELGLIVITHAGIDVGLPGHCYADTKMILNVIDTVHPEKFVLAHMGGWNLWDDVKKYIAGANVYFDTAFSLGPIVSIPGDPVKPCIPENLSQEQFYDLVKAHGTDKVLFATDSPWADQTTYINFMKNIPFTDNEFNDIMGENAKKLLNI